MQYEAPLTLPERAVFLSADFFWVDDGQYGLIAGTLLVLGSVFWVGAFVGLAAAVRRRAPGVAIAGLLVGVYGAVCGGAAFGLQGVFNELYGVAHSDALVALDGHPVIANAIFWVGGPAFPAALLIFGIHLALARRSPWWVSAALIAGAMLFPLARIPRVEAVAVAIDLLLLMPAWYLAAAMLAGARLRLRRADDPAPARRPAALS
jgi:hypothetical protein